MARSSAAKDPAASKKAVRTAAKAEREADVDRVEKVVALFIERHVKPKTRDWRETERILLKEIAPRWQGRRLSQITRAHVHEMLDEIVDRGAPIRANRVFAHFRNMCRWAMAERGIIERSPCDGMKAPSPERRRDRVLSDDEIRVVWRAFEGVAWPFGRIGQLLLLTGCRRDEIADMRWDEIDLTARTLSLPAARTKNKRDHVIPLSDNAVRIIKALPRIDVFCPALRAQAQTHRPRRGYRRRAESPHRASQGEVACRAKRRQGSLSPEGETRFVVADAVDALVKAVEAAHSTSLARIELDRGALQLRDELWGVAPSARHHPYEDDAELWRILMALPIHWLEEIRAHHHAGGVDMRPLGESHIRRADAA